MKQFFVFVTIPIGLVGVVIGYIYGSLRIGFVEGNKYVDYLTAWCADENKKTNPAVHGGGK